MKKGITLIMLTITMVILLILLSTVTITGFNTYNNNQKLTFATEINMIQMMVNSYKTKNDGLYPTNASFELNIAGVTANAKVQFSNETMTDNKVNLSKIDYEKLGITNLKYGNGTNGGEIDSYLVSEKTGIVYYAKGLKIGSNTYFTLTDDLKTMISVISPNTTIDNESGITFTVSETDFTSNSVETIVKVPVRYTGVSCTYLDTDLLNSGNIDFTTIGDYKVITVNELVNNYVLTINYNVDGQPKTTTYAVNNVDKNGPSLTLDSVKEKIVNTSDGYDVYLSLENVKDDKSGIKQIKYAEKYIGESEESRASSSEIANYFKEGGILVKNNTIHLYSPTKYVTIYAEDNVGNFSAIYYKLSDEMNNKLIEIDSNSIVTSAMIKADPEKYYGKTVTGYLAASSSLDKEWQIFHSDGSHIYLISKDYLNYNNQDDIVDNDECPNLPNGQVAGRHGYNETLFVDSIGLGNVLNYYNGASDISVTNPVIKKISYINRYPDSMNQGIIVTAFMVDQNVWKTYLGTNAEYAIGGPTLEQFIDSYNSVSHIAGKEKIYFDIDSNGYKVSFENGNYIVNNSNNIIIIDSDYDGMYIHDSSKNIDSYLIASPCTIRGTITFMRMASHQLGNNYYSINANSFRPLVCLKSGVTLEKNGDGFIIK